MCIAIQHVMNILQDLLDISFAPGVLLVNHVLVLGNPVRGQKFAHSNSGFDIFGERYCCARIASFISW